MPNIKSELLHPQLGTIIITRKPRARGIILRVRGGIINATLPLRCSIELLQQLIEKNIDKLKKQIAATAKGVINWEYCISAPNFSLCLKKSCKNSIRITGKEGKYIIQCPEKIDFNKETIQQQLRERIKAAIKHRAKEILPQRLALLSSQKQVPYNSVSVRDSHTRWGSCSSSGTISLSIYLVLLPQHLIDYVLMHELCHTIEMNHSARFWAQLDRLCGTSSKQLRNELRAYRTDF